MRTRSFWLRVGAVLAALGPVWPILAQEVQTQAQTPAQAPEPTTIPFRMIILTLGVVVLALGGVIGIVWLSGRRV